MFLELLRRQEDLRRIDELRSHEIDRRRNMMPMHRTDTYNNNPINNLFHQNDFQQVGYPTSPDAAYTTNQVARGYNLPSEDNFIQQQQQQYGFERKRPRY